MAKILLTRRSDVMSERQKKLRTIKNCMGEKQGKRSGLSFRTHELGGHMDLKENEESETICPSNEYVFNVLKDCGKRLGIDYVIR